MAMHSGPDKPILESFSDLLSKPSTLFEGARWEEASPVPSGSVPGVRDGFFLMYGLTREMKFPADGVPFMAIVNTNNPLLFVDERSLRSQRDPEGFLRKALQIRDLPEYRGPVDPTEPALHVSEVGSSVVEKLRKTTAQRLSVSEFRFCPVDRTRVYYMDIDEGMKGHVEVERSHVHG